MAPTRSKAEQETLLMNDTVQFWMSAPAVTAGPATTLPAARALLAERRIRRLPVVDAAGRLLGIVTEGDINRISDSPAGDLAEHSLYYRVRDLPLREFMRRPAIAATPETPLHEAAELMLAYHIHGLPVVDGERVVGVLTVSDLLRRLLADAEPAELLAAVAEA